MKVFILVITEVSETSEVYVLNLRVVHICDAVKQRTLLT